MTPDHTALDSVRLIQVAHDRADHMARLWPGVSDAILAACPESIRQSIPDRAWITLVVLFASPDEDHTTAAERVAKYLLAYQETWGRLPTLATMQRHAADRHLQEPR